MPITAFFGQPRNSSIFLVAPILEQFKYKANPRTTNTNNVA